MTTSISPALQRAADVLQTIQSNIKNDNGAKAELKRAMTGEPRHKRAIYPFILRYLSERESNYQLEAWLLVTSFMAYHSHPIDPLQKSTFGHHARQLMNDNNSGGPERRFRALLDTSIDDLRSPLTALVRLMKSKNIGINYPQLLVDLCQWDHPDQYVQDKWARAFWNAPSSNTQAEEDKDELTKS